MAADLWRIVHRRDGKLVTQGYYSFEDALVRAARADREGEFEGLPYWLEPLSMRVGEAEPKRLLSDIPVKSPPLREKAKNLWDLLKTLPREPQALIRAFLKGRL